MNPMTPQPIFALDFGDIVPVLVVLFGIISWIMNALKEKKQEAERPVRRDRNPRKESLQNEIDIFIQEVTEQGGKQQPQKQALPPTPPRRRETQTPVRSRVTRTTAEPARLATPEPPKPAHKKPGGDIASRKGPGSLDLGGSLSRHVQQHMQSHSISQESERRLGHHVNESVMEHLGKSSTSQEDTPQVPGRPAVIDEVRRLMSNPANMGQAILLNEILSPPRSRRR